MPPKGTKPVAQNRRARHDFDIVEVFEAGIVLQGSEVKSLREGKVQLREAYARVDDGEVWLHGMHIAPYTNASSFGTHEPDRARKLLLHRREIETVHVKTTQQPLTLIPLAIYFKENLAKVELALARGRKTYDKRHAIAERDAARDADRVTRAHRDD
jgi:SsrA-binding protein